MYWPRQLSERVSSDCLLKYLYATTMYPVSSLDIWCPRLSLQTFMEVTFWYHLSGTSNTKEALSQQPKCLYNLNLDFCKTSTQFSVPCPWIEDNFIWIKACSGKSSKGFSKCTQQFLFICGLDLSGAHLCPCVLHVDCWLSQASSRVAQLIQTTLINPQLNKDNHAIHLTGKERKKTSSLLFINNFKKVLTGLNELAHETCIYLVRFSMCLCVSTLFGRVALPDFVNTSSCPEH